MSEVLSARGLGRTYHDGPVPVTVLEGLDLEVAEGEMVAVVGESGVGKSTLLHVLGALDRPDSGEVLFRGRPLPSDGRARALWRNREVGFVFQFHHLLPEFTAVENVAFPARIAGVRPGEALAHARRRLDELGLGERADHFPEQLSGGERQRVAFARAVRRGTSVVLADEPTGNLDPRTGDQVFALLRRMQHQHGFAAVVATHSERLAEGCDRILHLAEGRLMPLRRAELGWSDRR
jgi:lipoprotein-releasing system ATP-binding protein